MGEYRKLWWTLIAVLTVTFAILGISGVEVYRKAPMRNWASCSFGRVASPCWLAKAMVASVPHRLMMR